MPVLRGVPRCVKSSLRYRPLTVNATFLGKHGHPLRKVALRDAVSIQTAVTVSAPPMLVCVETLQISKTACAKKFWRTAAWASIDRLWSPLLTYLGMKGADAVALLREKRP